MKNLRIAAALCLAIMAMPCQQKASAQKQTSTPKAESQSVAPTDRLRGWHKFVTWPEGITAWAIILTLGAIAYQSIWTRKSVQEIARHERPWILIEKIRFVEPGTVIRTLGQQDRLEPEAFHFSLRNYGRTPARITALQARTDIGSSPDVPPYPGVYELKNFAVNPHIIPQGRKRPHSALLEPPMSDKQYLLILSGGLFLWACAAVRYEDVHGNKYETRVCFRNNPDANKVGLLRLDGPAEYNNAT